MIITDAPRFAIPAALPTTLPDPPTALEPVLLVHGTFANKRKENQIDWWQRGSGFCLALDGLLQAAGSKACCWAHLGPASAATSSPPFAWTGENVESERRRAGRALAADIESLEADPKVSRYHLVGHSHGGNVIVNALRGLPRSPTKLGSVVYMGTPYLAFHHAAPMDTRWISIPMYAAALAGCVYAYQQRPGEHVGWGIAIFAVLLAVIAEFAFTRSRTKRAETALYGSGRPRAFVFDCDEAISGLVSAQHIVKSPRTFIDQFVRTTPPPEFAVAPRAGPEESFAEELKDSGVYAIIDFLSKPAPVAAIGQWPAPAGAGSRVDERLDGRWRSGLKVLDDMSSSLPIKPAVLAVLWSCLLVPRLIIAAVAAARAFVMGFFGMVVRALLFVGAKLLARIALPVLVRKAAFGADLGSFVAVSSLPPGVAACEPMTPELSKEAASVAGRLGSRAGQSILDAIASKDAFAIKVRVEHALTDASLAHSYYYQAPEIIHAISRSIAGSAPMQPLTLKSLFGQMKS